MYLLVVPQLLLSSTGAQPGVCIVKTHADVLRFDLYDECELNYYVNFTCACVRPVTMQYKDCNRWHTSLQSISTFQP